MINVFDITDFGATGNGKTDCTKAIQEAIDQAAKVRGAVIVPPGRYLCGQLKMRSGIHIKGYHGWGYRNEGGSIMILNDPKAQCLMDLTFAHASKIENIQFLGNNFLGDNIHALMLDYPVCNGDPVSDEDYQKEKHILSYDCHRTFNEDSLRIEGCQIRYFSGDGIHLNHMFAFKISNSMIIENAGDGIYANGCDGWIHDCIISFNGGSGIGAVKPDNNGGCAIASVAIINNRIEWNRDCGINAAIADSLNINNNCFDRCIGPAIKLGDIFNRNITINANTFRRNGAARIKIGTDEILPFEDEYDNSQIYIKTGSNISVTANVFGSGRDDTDGTRPWSPNYSIVYKNLKNCVITGNVMDEAAIEENLKDLGGHTESLIVENNPGSLKKV